MSYLTRFLMVSCGLPFLLFFCAGRTSGFVYAQQQSGAQASEKQGERKADFGDRLLNSAGQSKPEAKSAKSVLDSEDSNTVAEDSPKTPGKQGVYFKGADGQYIPLPNLNLDQVLEYLKQKQAAQVEQSPEYAVSSVSLTGTIKEDRAILDARIVVLINEEQKWIRVPLKLNESIFLKTGYSGAGESSPGGI